MRTTSDAIPHLRTPDAEKESVALPRGWFQCVNARPSPRYPRERTSYKQPALRKLTLENWKRNQT
jgi:hypothetical protein